jgi:hypothetical protein
MFLKSYIKQIKKTNMKKITRFILLMMVTVVWGNLKVMAQPTVAAPAPPAYSAAKVISIFSDAFTNVTGTIFNPNWSQTTVDSIVQIAGVNTLRYSALNYQGTQLATYVNATSMKFLHVDVWSADETSLQITPISPAISINQQHSVYLTPLVQNTWNSYDIPLSSFIGVSMDEVFQFEITGSGGKTVYIENLYFYDNDPTPDTEAPTGFTATKGAVTYNSVELLLNAMDNSGSVNYTITYGTKTLTTGSYSGVQKSFVVNGLNDSTDYSFSIVANDMAGNAASNNPLVVIATTRAGLIVPTTIAVPLLDSIPAANVISIFDDNFTAIPNIDYSTNWNQKTFFTTYTIVTPTGNHPVLKYDNFDYQGIDFNGSHDASAMTMLHIDVFTPNETSISVQLISMTTSGPAVALSPINLNVWNSYDIPLSAFVGLSKSDIHQFMTSNGSGGKVVYLDNIFLYSNTTTGISTMEASDLFKCYPSMVTNNLNVVAGSDISLISVHNLLGQLVNFVTVNATEKLIDLSTVSAGNYFVTVKMSNGQQSTQKIVKL